VARLADACQAGSSLVLQAHSPPGS